MKRLEADNELEGLLRAWVPGSRFASKAYVVGGYVRDRLLGLPGKDVDVVVEEPGGAEAFSAALHAELKALDPESISSPHLLGRGYPIWSLSFRKDLHFGGRHFATAGQTLEIADTQSESFPDPTSRQRVSRFGSLDEDCARRDFTVNMLYLDLASGEVRDPSGRGLADLERSLLAGHPRVDIAKIFSDDPLRMLRLYRFQSRFGWPLEPRAVQAARDLASRFRILSAERVRDELTKLLLGAHVRVAMEGLRESGLLAEALPELLPMIGCGQDKRYHSEGDVWVHTLGVIEKSPARPLLRWAALLHDVGKPATRSVEGERIKFLGHEKVSVDLARGILERLRFPPDFSASVLNLIALHLRGGDSPKWGSLKPARKLAREAGADLESLLELIEADSSASLGPDGRPRLEHIPVLRQALTEALRVPIHERPVLNGREVMELLSLPGGPELGRVLAELRDYEDSVAAEGRALSKDEAREWLRTRSPR